MPPDGGGDGATPTKVFLDNVDLKELPLVQQGFIRPIRRLELELKPGSSAEEV